MSPDGKTVASAGVDRRIHLWKATRRGAASLEVPGGETIALLGFSPDGRTLTAVGHGGAGTVAVWDAAGGKQRSAFSLAEKHFPNGLALSPDAALVAAFGPPDDDRFAVFDAAKGEMLSRRQEDGLRRLLQPGAFLDGKTLAVFRHPDGLATKTGSLLLWDAAAGAGDVQDSKPTSGRSSGPSPRPTAGSSPRPGREGASGSGTSPPER